MLHSQNLPAILNRIRYLAEENIIEIDVEDSTLSETYRVAPGGWGGCHRAPFERKPGEKLNLRIFLDRSIMEVYVNKCQCITQRIYPSRADSQGITLFAQGGEMSVTEFNAWKIHPSNPW